MKSEKTLLTPAYQAELLRLLGNQPSTHALVNPLIQGAFSRNWPVHPLKDTENTLLRALRNWWSWPVPVRWERRRLNTEYIRVADFGFDLANRPSWLESNSGVKYSGFRLPDEFTPGPALSAEGKVRSLDWTKLTPSLLEKELLLGLGETRPPNWILAIDVLNHLEDPRPFLQAVAAQYHQPEYTGHMLVAVRSRAFFNKVTGAEAPAGAAHLHRQVVLRRAFRDAGMEIVDEYSPPLPLPDPQRMTDEFPSEDAQTALFSGMAPLHFWVLRMNMSRREPATLDTLQEWLAELDQADASHRREHRRGFQRHASARLILETLLAPRVDPTAPAGAGLQVNAHGLSWRSVTEDHPLLAARNTGGRVFIVRSGEVVAYHPEAPKTLPQTSQTAVPAAPIVRAHRGPNDLVGELEVFDQHDDLADRMHLWTLRAPPAAAVAASQEQAPPKVGAVALEISPDQVQRLLADKKVLNNPLLRDLRSKSLEAELGFRLGLKFHFLQRKNSKKNGDDVDTDLDDALRFSGRFGVRKVSRSTVAQVACLLERAAEHDREWGIPHSRQGRMLVFHNLYHARSAMYTTDGSNAPDKNTNHAIQFLERCGAIRPFTLSSNVIGAGKGGVEKTKLPPNSREPVIQPPTQAEATAHAAKLRDRAKEVAEHVKSWKLRPRNAEGSPLSLKDLMAERYPLVPSAYKHLAHAFKTAPQYVAVVIRSEYLLRRLAMDLSGPLLDDFTFAREALPFPNTEALMAEDIVFAEEGVHHLWQRAQLGLAHIDSAGLRFFDPKVEVPAGDVSAFGA